MVGLKGCLAGAFLGLGTAVAQAQAQARPAIPISTWEIGCIRQFSDPRGCAEQARIARSRYGDRATLLQWNSAAGVVRHQRRQGKF
jgi:hypothetical protein